jgi:hypothetical protein
MTEIASTNAATSQPATIVVSEDDAARAAFEVALEAAVPVAGQLLQSMQLPEAMRAMRESAR